MSYKDLIQEWKYSGDLPKSETNCFKVCCAFRKHFLISSKAHEFQMKFIDEYLQTSRYFSSMGDKTFWYIFEQTSSMCLSDMPDCLLKEIWNYHRDIFNGYLHQTGSWDDMTLRYSKLMDRVEAETAPELQAAYSALLGYLMDILFWLGR